MKFVPILGDVEAVMCSVLFQNLVILYEGTNWSEHDITLACFCLKSADYLKFLSKLLVLSCLNIFSYFSFKFLVWIQRVIKYLSE